MGKWTIRSKCVRIFYCRFRDIKIREKKIIQGEQAQNEVITEVEDGFRIETFNMVIDTAISSMKQRFNVLNSMFLSLLDPRNFDEIKSKGLKILVNMIFVQESNNSMQLKLQDKF